MYSPKYTLTNEILEKIVDIERLKDRVKTAKILPKHEAEIRYRATIESTHSSTSIEGNPLTLKQVGVVLSGKPLMTRQKYAEIEVANYGRALNFIANRRFLANILEEKDILRLHSIISDGLLDRVKSGMWRKNMVYVVNQREEVVYTAAPVESIDREISEMLDWVNSSEDVHILIRAAVLHFQFVSIHPFSDGNGRTTRALTSLFLGLNDYDFRGALALDSYYATDKAEYYRALQIQGGRYETAKEADLTSWIEYFLEGFLSCVKILSAEIEILSGAVRATDNIHKLAREDMDILDYVEQFGEITAGTADEIVIGGRRTAQRRLKDLVDAGYLKQVGNARGTKYVKETRGASGKDSKYK